MLEKDRVEPLIYYLCYSGEDVCHSKELLDQISLFGYDVRTFQDVPALEKACDIQGPTVLIVDEAFSNKPGNSESKTAFASFAKRISSKASEPLRMFFISHDEKLEDRLQAVRLGGEAFFVKPFDFGGLIDALDKIAGRSVTAPYRVLIVDDSRVSARFAQTTLQKTGIEAEIVTEPMQIMGTLVDFNPDLILLDVYMPDCTGMELAKVIRQMERFVSIPIVYLSSEEDRDMQLEAMSSGADDFINKMDLKGHQLIAAVKTRMDRYRALRTLMMRDSLTGLLNHTTIKERMNQEMARAKRMQIAGKESYVSIAMLDIDLFKSVNDSYGHATGDRVLKSLSRFLTQRLRQSDTVGRYGGEEFAVILHDTDGVTSVKVMDEIRENFAKIMHQADGDEFSVTFSVGVASFPEFSDLALLSDAADQALYAAKRNGRNQVVFAGLP